MKLVTSDNVEGVDTCSLQSRHMKPITLDKRRRCRRISLQSRHMKPDNAEGVDT